MQQWRDEYLQWSPANYSDIQYVSVDIARLWVPNYSERRKSAMALPPTTH